MKVKESEIKNAIWQLCDAGRGFFPSIKSQVDLILVLLKLSTIDKTNIW